MLYFEYDSIENKFTANDSNRYDLHIKKKIEERNIACAYMDDNGDSVELNEIGVICLITTNLLCCEASNWALLYL